MGCRATVISHSQLLQKPEKFYTSLSPSVKPENSLKPDSWSPQFLVSSLRGTSFFRLGSITNKRGPPGPYSLSLLKLSTSIGRSINGGT